MAESKGPRILIVSDDPELLDRLQAQLRFRYKLSIASSAALGLEHLGRHADTAVIVSTMRMPALGGIGFLAAARARRPDARRILICNDSDLSATVAAIEDGQLCRLLLQPFDMTALMVAIEFALEQRSSEMQVGSAIHCASVRTVAAFDRLTGLASRRGLIEAIESCGGGADGVQAPAIFLMQLRSSPADVLQTDLAAAEPVLMEIAHRLTELRPQALCLARWGLLGVAVLEIPPDPTPDALIARAQELIEGLTFSCKLGKTAAFVDVSVGIVTMGAQMSNARIIMGNAELAEGSAHATSRVPMLCMKPLPPDRLELHYQPVIDVRRGTLHAVEALVRWSHPHYGPIAPGTFIPAFKSARSIAPFGEWALQRMCAEASAVLDCGFPTIAINLSMMQVLDPGFLDGFRAALDEASLSPSIVGIEIADSVCAYDLDLVRSMLTDLRRLGIRTTIDDFGKGCTSLGYLSQLPVSVVKTDASFVRDFDCGGEAVIAATLSMAARLGLETIVEGIETAAMLERVRGVGATLLQGFWLARPMPVTALRGWCEQFRKGMALPMGAPLHH
jgi:EAL domain-containing protein (putative c-di-GMP-specific phosphodiesterase class I)/CheY-like chemotaxis protein